MAAPSNGDLIAFYGSLMRRLGAMDALGIADDLRFIGPCVIEGQLLDLGDYPGLRAGPGRVIGEIHVLLDARAVSVLDRFEDFDPTRRRESVYLREKIELVEPSRTEAWVYFLNRVPNPERKVGSGDWRAHLANQK